MNSICKLFCILLLGFASLLVSAQGLDPARILKPLGEEWPTYAGDYTSRRYSSLKQINTANVKNLTLAWAVRLAGGLPKATGGRAPSGPPTIVGGEGTLDMGDTRTTIRASALMVDGILYTSAPDNAWAIDARTGEVLWHYFWKTRGGTHIGNRGMGMWKNYLFLETPDDYLVSLDARTGEERWHKEIADFNQQYFSTTAPVVVGNHVLVGTGDDLDAPGFLQSFDPETGELQWKYYTVPMNPGDPGLETWSSLDAARHGGAQVWMPGSYDPETNLYIFPTGNPTAAYTNKVRGSGDNLYTCSIIALNVDTAKMVWYYQTSPNDTHDWDSTQAPVLIDAPFKGKMRKLVLQAARNGYFFVLDRLTGEHLLTSKYVDSVNWAEGLDDKGRPKRDPGKDSSIPGTLVSPTNPGVTNWPPPSFSPDTGLLYVPTKSAYAMYYLNEPDPRKMMGLTGKDELALGPGDTHITAIDYKTGKVAWQHTYPFNPALPSGPSGGMGLLTTAGNLLFGGDVYGNLVAYNAANGDILWHTRLGDVSNAPQTYLLDGHQYILVAGGDTLYAFTLY